jgi:hypothetical protein
MRFAIGNEQIDPAPGFAGLHALLWYKAAGLPLPITASRQDPETAHVRSRPHESRVLYHPGCTVFSALGDNALLFAAIALLASLHAAAWHTPVLQQFLYLHILHWPLSSVRSPIRSRKAA